MLIQLFLPISVNRCHYSPRFQRISCEILTLMQASSGWFYMGLGGGGGEGGGTKYSRPFSLKRLKLLQPNLVY